MQHGKLAECEREFYDNTKELEEHLGCLPLNESAALAVADICVRLGNRSRLLLRGLSCPADEERLKRLLR